jgi:hypothetical protein
VEPVSTLVLSMRVIASALRLTGAAESITNDAKPVSAWPLAACNTKSTLPFGHATEPVWVAGTVNRPKLESEVSTANP